MKAGGRAVVAVGERLRVVATMTVVPWNRLYAGIWTAAEMTDAPACWQSVNEARWIEMRRCGGVRERVNWSLKRLVRMGGGRFARRVHVGRRWSERVVISAAFVGEAWAAS